MTLNGVSSYSSSIYGSSSAALSGLVQSVSSSRTEGKLTEGNAGVPARMPSRFDGASQEAAKAKLESVNPDLAKKMEEFHQQVDEMRESGASKEEIHEAVQGHFESLTNSEKADLQSAFGGKDKGGSKEDPLSSLKQTNPELAEKLESFKAQIEQMKDDGATADDIRSTMKSNMESLTDTEKSDMHSAMRKGGRPSGPPPGPPPGGSRQGSSTDSVSSYAQSQASTLYTQAKTLLEQLQSQPSFAYSA